MKIADCKHLPEKIVGPRAKMCEEHKSPTPFSLRVCLTCGHVGCCDSTIGQHARAHGEKEKHFVMASYPADKTSFIWCYIDDDYLEPDSAKNLENLNS
jgi:monovalent cation/hydrogen antiporter